MSFQPDLVSVIIPVYNRTELLKEAVASVLDQTYRPIEILIVDDGSIDGTPEVIRRLAHDNPELRTFRQDHAGPGAARQLGLEHVHGEFVQFLDSDDLLLQDKFTAQVAALRNNPQAGVSYGKTRYVLQTGEVVAPWRRTGEVIMGMFPSMLAQRWWGTSTPLYRRPVLAEAGPITNLVNEEDWEFDCRIASQGVQLARVDDWVSEQRAVALTRASAEGSTDPIKLRDRARARHLILDSALNAQVPVESPEFQIFIHHSFLLARQCASASLAAEAEGLVRRLNDLVPRKMMSAYLVAGQWLGFKLTSRVAEFAHQFLRIALKKEIV